MKIIFTFCGDDIPIYCELNEKFNDVFQKYLLQTQLKIPVFILYNGNIIQQNSNQILNEIINKTDKDRNEAKMIVNKNDMDNDETNNNININNNKAKTSRENLQNQKKINELKHSYWNQQINDTNAQFKVDNNFENNNNFNFNNQTGLVLVNFKFENIYHPLRASKQIKMGKVCEKFAEIKNRKIGYFKFFYRGKEVDQNQNVGHYFENNNTDGITIIVEDNKPCYCRNRNRLIAIGSVLIGIIILAVIIIASQVAKSNSKSSNSKISKTDSYAAKKKLMNDNLINNTNIKISNIFRINDSLIYFQKK